MVWAYDWAYTDALHATPNEPWLWRPDGELRRVSFEEYECEWHERECWNFEELQLIEAYPAADGWRYGYWRYGFLQGPHEPAFLFVRRLDGDVARLDKDIATADELGLSLHRYLALSPENRDSLSERQALLRP